MSLKIRGLPCFPCVISLGQALLNPRRKETDPRAATSPLPGDFGGPGLQVVSEGQRQYSPALPAPEMASLAQCPPGPAPSLKTPCPNGHPPVPVSEPHHTPLHSLGTVHVPKPQWAPDPTGEKGEAGSFESPLGNQCPPSQPEQEAHLIPAEDARVYRNGASDS